MAVELPGWSEPATALQHEIVGVLCDSNCSWLQATVALAFVLSDVLRAAPSEGLQRSVHDAIREMLALRLESQPAETLQ